MKSKFTLTTLFTLAILLVSFTVVSASTLGDDSCKTKCCKNKKAKTASIAVAEIDKALKEMEADIEYVTAVAVTKHIKRSVKALQVKKMILRPETAVMVMAFDVADETKDVDAKQKINFNALDKEMNQVQEDLSKMDDGLKCDDVKNRKAAEDILKTGIKS
jgi:DNA-binding protein YbaB